MRYCPNCGSEVAEGTKFCKSCGAAIKSATAVEKKNQAVVVKKDSANKLPIMKIAAMLVVVILCIGVLSKVIGAVSVPAYEKPLKTQIDAINENDVDKYLESFTAVEREEYKNYFSKEEFEEVKNVRYEVVGTSEESIGSALDFLDSYGISDLGIEDAKRLDVELEFETVSGENGSNELTFDVIKINGKWYAMDSLF